MSERQMVTEAYPNAKWSPEVVGTYFMYVPNAKQNTINQQGVYTPNAKNA